MFAANCGNARRRVFAKRLAVGFNFNSFPCSAESTQRFRLTCGAPDLSGNARSRGVTCRRMLDGRHGQNHFRCLSAYQKRSPNRSASTPNTTAKSPTSTTSPEAFKIQCVQRNRRTDDHAHDGTTPKANDPLGSIWNLAIVQTTHLLRPPNARVELRRFILSQRSAAGSNAMLGRPHHFLWAPNPHIPITGGEAS